MGFGGALLVALRWAQVGRSYAAAEAGGTTSSTTPDDTLYTLLCVSLFTVALVGLIAAIPQVLAALGGRSGGLPLSARLALRDIARSRHRTAPAVAAVLAATTLGASAMVMIAGVDRTDRADWVPSTPHGFLSVYSYASDATGSGEAGLAAALDVVRGRVAARTEYLTTSSPVAGVSCDEAGDDRSCAYGSARVAPLALLVALARDADGPQVQRVLDQGGAVSFDRTLAGSATVQVARLPDGGLEEPLAVAVPVVVLTPREPSQLTGRDMLYVSAATAQRIGATGDGGAGTKSHQAILDVGRDLTGRERKDLDAALAGQQAGVSGWQPYDSPARNFMLALLAATVFVGLVGTAISTALSVAEQQVDLAVLGAVGASPRRRRTVAAGQALAVATVGAILGLAFGVTVGLVMLAATPTYPVAVPWESLGALLLVLPLVASGIAWAASRSGLPSPRPAD